MVAVTTKLCNIVFLDIEADKQKKIHEFGVVFNDTTLKTSSVAKIKKFIQNSNTQFIAGHNFKDFDLEIIKEYSLFNNIKDHLVIDTLPLSLLFFNEKTVHKLQKEYKDEDNNKNNDPVKDCKLTFELFIKLEKKYLSLEENMQNIFFTLLKDNEYFNGFFSYLEQNHTFHYLNNNKLYKIIVRKYEKSIVNVGYLTKIIQENRVELAYILALISVNTEIKSHPPKLLCSYPNIVDIQKKLCFDFEKIDKELSTFSKNVFGFGTFREFPRLNAGLLDNASISQKEIVQASLRDESFLTVLPTGGGKTFTFWLPAIIKANSYKSLTVVISPLQALIEDHISNFNENVANYKAVAISGFLSPLEREEAISQTINGEADILYIAPESLRSNSIFNILKNRVIERFVIDEAHCLSTWGSDFRQDYYYICEYIRDLIDKKPFQDHIPISCFTATAKPKVIKDIKEYFFDGLSIELDEYIAIPERKNLIYKSIPLESKDKYVELLKLVNNHNGSTLIYIPSSTKSCDETADKLALDTDKRVKSFHSKLQSQEKMAILKDYISNKVDIIVATTAFGMGVDKPDITQVIHYEMSDSLENYAQEAGRGARDKDLEALCPILYDQNDLDKHFSSLNRSKVTNSDINSIFMVLKKYKANIVYKSVFELAKEAGWDVEDSSLDYATKVKTILLELEREEYIQRKRNRVRFYADSIAKDSIDKLDKILSSAKYKEEEKKRLKLIHSTIIGRGKSPTVQVDELAYLLGYKKEIISQSIYQLKDMEILSDNKDLSLEVKKWSLKSFEDIKKIELALYSYLTTIPNNTITIKELNEYITTTLKTQKNNSESIKEILRNWRDKMNFSFTRINRHNDLWSFKFIDRNYAKEALDKKHDISIKLLDYFSSKIESMNKIQTIEFSLKIVRQSIGKEFQAKDIDKTLLYLHHLRILDLLNGRFINYAPMEIHKNEKFQNKRRYTKDEYKKRLEKHYLSKIESIHIMGEYAKKLQTDKSKAISFMKDYFTSPYDDFKKKYNLLKKKITRPITEHRYNKIYSKLSLEQQNIISDKDTKAMMILAGPGSGKTKVLVHKIASLILTEDIHPEQFMMLTFSRSAMLEFRSRLNELIGSLSFDIEINTFHAYALKLIAREIKKDDKKILNDAIVEATRQLRNADVTIPLKTVLVLDEFQDISKDSFELVKAIYEKSDKEIKIIAVGDDDQCINTHAGADVTYIDNFKEEFGEDEDSNNLFKQYELLTNFRSKKNIVEYSNSFIENVSDRYKTQPLKSNSTKDGIVTVHTCKSKNLIAPVIELIKEDKQQKDIAILAFTNEEVMQIYSNLQEFGINARFIIDREKFKLKDIIEIVEFDKVVNGYLRDNVRYKEDDFYVAFEIIESRFKGSKNLKLLKRVVDRFLYESEEYYVSQWLSYLEEIKLEEFDDGNKTITVSTIHKSKGMEFDKVILIINDKKIDNKKRLYYVGMTRAKDELIIVQHGNNMSGKYKYANYLFNEKEYAQNVKTNTIIMSLKDIYLRYDYQKKYANLDLIAGKDIKLKKENNDKFSIIYENKEIGNLSKKFKDEIRQYSGKYSYKAKIDYIVLWNDKENNKYIKHPLCKFTLTMKV